MATAPTHPRPVAPTPSRLVAVGGSAGAIDALLAFLPGLPAGWPHALAVVVHLPRRAPSALAEVLGAATALAVREADDKEPVVPGTVYVARPGYHLLVAEGPTLALDVDDADHRSIPSIDHLLASAAASLGRQAVGIVLSGASEDGAEGLAQLRAAGGLAVVQAPEDAAFETMPRAALRRCPDATAVPAAALARLLAGALPAAQPAAGEAP